MQDIADRLGISVAAVSKVLSDKPGISDEMRTKVRQTALEIGYRTNPIKKKSPLVVTRSIAIIAAEIFLSDDSFYLKFYKHISDFLQTNEYCGFFHTISVSDERELVLPKILISGNVDGVIILGKISKKYSELIAQNGLPMVFLDYYDERTEIDCIICDSFYAAYDLTNYLIRNGHQRIAFVGSIWATSSIQDRFLGFKKSLMEQDIFIPKDYVIDDRDVDGHLLVAKLPAEMPTAFVCNCDETACRLIRQLRELGYRIPDDISVTGFDNSIYSFISDPKITTVEVNTEQMSQLAVETILKKINKPDSNIGRIRINGKIVYKNSVKSVNK